MDGLVLRWVATESDAIAVRRRGLARATRFSAIEGLLFLWAVCAFVWWSAGPVAAPVAVAGGVLWPVVWLYALWREPRRQVALGQREGLLPLGPIEARLGPGGVCWTQEAANSHFRWSAFGGVDRDRLGLWLRLGPNQVLLVPERALVGADLAPLEGWRADPGPLDAVPFGPEFERWVLEAELDVDDWVRAVVASERLRFRRIGRRLLGLAALAVAFFWGFRLLGAVGADVRMAGWIALVGLGYGAKALAVDPVRRWAWRRQVRRDPRQLPLGAATWRVGPGGLWVASSRGTSRFTWSYLPAVERDRHQVRMTVGLLAVLVIPVRAFRSDEDVDAFVGEVRGWIDGAPRLRGGRPPAGRGPLESTHNPFATPDRGR